MKKKKRLLEFKKTNIAELSPQMLNKIVGGVDTNDTNETTQTKPTQSDTTKLCDLASR